MKIKPYRNEKVHVAINDVRVFIRKTEQKYDLIVYAFGFNIAIIFLRNSFF